jgi:hypothetical protein
MVQRTRQVKRTAKGSPAMDAGGGSFTNTYNAITVLKPTAAGYLLKPASFIKTAGDRAARTDQVIIPIEVNDVVITMYGKLPISDDNPEATIKAYKITEITDRGTTETEIPITHREIPPSVITGAGIYHNREGSYFCNPVIQED